MNKWIVKYKDELMDDEVIEAEQVSFEYPGLIALQNGEYGAFMVAVFNIDVIISIKCQKE